MHLVYVCIYIYIYIYKRASSYAPSVCVYIYIIIKNLDNLYSYMQKGQEVRNKI